MFLLSFNQILDIWLSIPSVVYLWHQQKSPLNLSLPALIRAEPTRRAFRWHPEALRSRNSGLPGCRSGQTAGRLQVRMILFPSSWRGYKIKKKKLNKFSALLEHFVFVFITKPNHQPARATLILLPSNRGLKIARHCGQSGLIAQSVAVLVLGWLLQSSFLFFM